MEDQTVIMKKEQNTILVYHQDALILELKDCRFLRFRSCGRNENWIGGEGHGSDQTVAYDERELTPLKTLSTECKELEDGFQISVNSQKTELEKDSLVQFTIRGIWQPQEKWFAYEMQLSLTADTEEWYRKSYIAQAYNRQTPPRKSRIQMFDYRVELICDRQRQSTQTLREEPVRYDWFFSSQDGHIWEKWPKVHLPYPVCPGNYLTMRTGDRMQAGSCYGFGDGKFGGWMTTILHSTAPVNYEICWAVLDVHVMLYDALPLLSQKGPFHVSVGLLFNPMTPEQVLETVAAASERNWRAESVYQLPVLTQQNHFETLLTDLPSEETEYAYLWWKSSPYCFVDRENGCGDTSSASIRIPESTQYDSQPSATSYIPEATHPEAQPSAATSCIPESTHPDAQPSAAWNTYNWTGACPDFSTRKSRMRLSAMVRTENCTGAVRLVHAVSKNGAEFFYGNGTHDALGRRRTDLYDWHDSRTLTGTNDWTELSLEFDTLFDVNVLILEQVGPGQSWFDQVKIERIGDLQSEADDNNQTDETAQPSSPSLAASPSPTASASSGPSPSPSASASSGPSPSLSASPLEYWYLDNTRFPANTDEGIRIPRMIPGSLEAVSDENTEYLHVSTEDKVLPRTLSLYRKMPPYALPLTIEAEVRTNTRQAVLFDLPGSFRLKLEDGFLCAVDLRGNAGKEKQAAAEFSPRSCESSKNCCESSKHFCESSKNCCESSKNASESPTRIPCGAGDITSIKVVMEETQLHFQAQCGAGCLTGTLSAGPALYHSPDKVRFAVEGGEQGSLDVLAYTCHHQ